MIEGSSTTAYWQKNLSVIRCCLLIWATVSFGFGILLRPLLAKLPISIGGVDLGFWFAQQGSILVFIALIFYYNSRMERLDREFNVDEL
jgi:putative solute:sodium symporter small subunit